MIRLREIQDALMGVVGWAQELDPAKRIDPRLCRTESGLTYQGAHPLVTLENLRAVVRPDTFTYPAWNNIRRYYPGDIVEHEGLRWICRVANKSVEPHAADFNDDYGDDFGITPGPWELYDYFSEYVRRITTEAVTEAVQQFIARKQLARETKDLVERRTFFDGAARLKATIDPRGKIVGFEIVPVRAMGVTTKIERIGLQMVGATGPVRLYLFHSSQVDPVRVLDFDYTNTSGGFQWFTPREPVYLPYISDGTDAGGAWFLCYNQSDLPDGMRALNVSKDWSVEPCQTCLGGSIESWKQITKYMQISPFCTKAPEDFREYPEMFDIGTLGYTNTMNYGMNVEVSVGCDLTDFLVSQRAAFATLLQRQVACNVLRTLAMNPDVRVNRNQVNVTREQVLYDLEGDPRGRASGLVYQLEQAYKAIEIDTQGLDRVCLKCNNHGVKYRTV